MTVGFWERSEVKAMSGLYRDLDEERREFADNEGAFAEWRASRVWCADFAAAGLEHAGTECDGDDPGYAYAFGCWIIDLGAEAKGGRYWTIVGNGELADDDLEVVERFLWNGHAKYETER